MMANYMRLLMVSTEDNTPGTPIRFVASTPGKKRDGMALDPNRWKLDNYRNNPVVLWVHDYNGKIPPIGRANVWIDAGKIYTDVTFDQDDEFARQVESKYRRGFLHAVSVGWDDLRDANGVWYDLLDISAVPVPADADALIKRQYEALSDLLAESQPAPDDSDTAANRTAQADGTRVGAMLNARNRADLKQAMTLIQGVMDRAEPAPDEAQGKDEDEDKQRAVNDDNTESVTAMWLYTQTIGGLR